jgi:hypothetical protein
MTFPFDVLNLSQRELGLVVAVVLGFLFGFVLERSGFGRATKLAAQFYLHDMTVFKVMFSAIVTAMLGLVIASGLGLADLGDISRSIASWTWIWPMLIGGLVLGAGFIISGYCPGTSLVAGASGNIDGMVAFGGVAIGSFIYSLLLEIPAFAKFHVSGEIGPKFLYELLGIPAPVLAVGVALMAIVAFVGAELVERMVTRRRERLAETTAPALRPRRLAFATFGAMSVIALALLAVPVGSGASPAPAPDTVTAAELARKLVDQPWTIRILDLRSADAFATTRIPGSENVAPEQVADLALADQPASRELVVVMPDGKLTVPATVMAYPGKTSVLAGGWPAWKSFALDVPAALAADATAAQREAWAFQSSVHAAMTGQKLAPPPAAPVAGAVAKPKKKGGGCSA